MNNRRDDLRATAEDLIADAHELQQIERRKLARDGSDPETMRLANQSEQLAAEMLAKARAQRRLVQGDG